MSDRSDNRCVGIALQVEMVDSFQEACLSFVADVGGLLSAIAIITLEHRVHCDALVSGVQNDRRCAVHSIMVV